MKKLRALIVDDEKLNRDILEVLVSRHCPEIEVVAKSPSAADARIQLQTNIIDLLFLDIAMPNESGFELLESIEKRDFSVIFITAYNHFAIKAIKASALDYLLKPIDIEELKTAISKAVALHLDKGDSKETSGLYDDNINSLIEQVHNGKEQITRISLPIKNGYKILELDQILYLEASNNYCILHLSSNEEFIISKTLKEYNDILEDNGFIRVHKSYLVNVSAISGYNRKDGMSIELTNGVEIPVSRRRQSLFLEVYNSNS